MDRQTLAEENASFEGTMGVSAENGKAGFIPAFRDEASGDVVVACFPSGAPAPMHLIAGLPREWATEFAEDGSIRALRENITAGFVRDEQFFTRDQACEACKG